MNMTVEQILAQTKAMIQTKQAEFKKKSSEATENPPESVGNMAGVGEDAKKPTPKARSDEKDCNVDETSGRTTAGAKHPDTGREQAVDATESVLTPAKKPEQSADANAKKASSELANDLLAAIRSYQKNTTKEAQVILLKSIPPAAPTLPPVVPAAAPAAEEPSKGEKEDSKADKKEEKGEKKEASPANELELTRDVLAKLAALMVASDEGRDLANKVMAKEAGVEAAKELIDFITVKQAEAEYARGQADAQAAIQDAIFQAGYKTAMDRQAQQAPAQAPKLSAEDMEYIKLGQAIADQGVADLQQAAAADPAAAAAMGGDPAAMGGDPAAMGGGEGEISMEDLAEAIDQLVSAGVIQPEEAQQIIEYLASAGGGEGGEGAPAAAPEAEEAGEKSEDEKEGSAKAQKINKLANALAANIGAARALAQTPPAKK